MTILPNNLLWEKAAEALKAPIRLGDYVITKGEAVLSRFPYFRLAEAENFRLAEAETKIGDGQLQREIMADTTKRTDVFSETVCGLINCKTGEVTVVKGG